MYHRIEVTQEQKGKRDNNERRGRVWIKSGHLIKETEEKKVR